MKDIDTIKYYIEKIPTYEVLAEDMIEYYVDNNIPLKHYIGFEISGFVHLGTGLICMRKVADFQKAGIETTLFLADYHSWINKKLGGDLDTIKKVALGYFKEALKMSLKAVGGDPEKVKVILGSELYEKLGREYLDYIIKFSLNKSLSRIKKGVSIMGRKENENVSFAQLLYIAMQAADIYGLGVNIAHGGLDQRKVHVLVLESYKELGYKPVIVHNSLLTGLHINEKIRNTILEAKKTGNRSLFEDSILDIKMSKSKPNSAIFVHDSEEEIRNKIKKAFCPIGEIELNPIIEITKYIIFPILEDKNENFEIKNLKTGEKYIYTNFTDLEKDYISKKIHPLDLKNAVAEYLIEILEPIRKYFLEGKGSKYIEEMKNIKVTR